MISPTALALAVALPLLCLLMLLVILLLRSRRLRASDAIDQQQLQDKYAKLEERLATFPKAWTSSQPDSGFSREEVIASWYGASSKMVMYLQNWINVVDPKNESATRIEALLFSEIPPEHRLATGKNTRTFPNPHQYTPAEICTFLEQANTREAICNHIMSSILLQAISFDGYPFYTLLPITPPDMYGLHKLKTMIRGVDLCWNVRVHISKFGFTYAREAGTKARYITLFESLFNPYFTMKSPEDVSQRQKDLRGVLDAFIQHGLKMVGQAFEESEYRWGSRDDNSIMMVPALHNLGYEDGVLKREPELVVGSRFKVKYD